MRKTDKREPLIATGEIKSGKFEWTTAFKFVQAALTRWPDGRLDITFAQREDTRSARANRYMWGVVLRMMAAESGVPAEEMHELMKLRHNFTTVIDPNGEEVKVGQSTSKLTVSEFTDYLERVMLDGSEWLGIIFPEPRHEDNWR